MKKFLRLALAVAVAALPVLINAQTTLTQTTLSAAVTSVTQNRIQVASATGISVGTRLYVDRELMTVQSISGTNVVVARGTGGSPTNHASGAAVLAGPSSYFYQSAPTAGPCTATAETATPRIVVPTGDIYTCSQSVWVRTHQAGFPYAPSATLLAQYTASGALTVAPGVHLLNGTTLAMTLANPTIAQNGMIMYISAQNASAHTVTYTAGFGGGTTARDVATFGGAIGDGLVIFANAGTWWIISTRNVTLA